MKRKKIMSYRWVTKLSTGREVIVYAKDITNARVRLATYDVDAADEAEFTQCGYVDSEGRVHFQGFEAILHADGAPARETRG